ncbi:Very long-chain specific acyl-CoA dehydrogenase, mitochondrial [Hypsibius exemplaris]|uniref:Very long-chain specific acyl-CoA dehydrogenase, mitochondrial n=1 Tax=Hypsibius exemplaris TaxID=2072580 RepID=A0A1W0WS34_HYPEX|nr:Very long-chain specific acyl-CoA dehydrogenase, mitochondrial [Hypsibius exemplaris]
MQVASSLSGVLKSQQVAVSLYKTAFRSATSATTASKTAPAAAPQRKEQEKSQPKSSPASSGDGKPKVAATPVAAKAVRDPKARMEKKAQDSKSFVANLFRGRAVTDQIFPFPSVLDDEQKDTLRSFVEPTNKFFEEVNDAAKNDETSKIPDHVTKGMAELGAFGLMVPQEYNGLGVNNTQYARLAEIVGGHDLAIGIFMGSHQSIGFKGIMLSGTDKQKEQYLPKLATGEHFAAFALTEPQSGSDAASIRSKAVLSPDGKHYILNGQKIWISNGGFADVFTVFAQTDVKDDDGNVKEKMTAFIVERKHGVKSGPPENKMGIKSSNTAELYFDDVKIPVENVLGGVGNGFKVAMNVLNNGRFGMAAAMAGTMRNVIKQSVAQANTRQQFGHLINNYGAIQEKLARMSMVHYVTESMAYHISGTMDDGGKDYQLEAAISKVYGSEAAWFTTDEAIQIFGGMGFMKATGLERVLRDLRIFRIFEGSNDVMRLFVALTGMQYAGGHLRELQKALKNPVGNLGLVVNEGLTRGFRKIGIRRGDPSFGDLVNPALKDSADLVSHSVGQFGETVEALLAKYRQGIVDEQFILKRVADAAIDIYAMTVSLSRATRSIKEAKNTAGYETKLVSTFCHEAAQRVSQNLGLTRSSRDVANFKAMSELAQEMCQQGGVVQEHPLGF